VGALFALRDPRKPQVGAGWTAFSKKAGNLISPPRCRAALSSTRCPNPGRLLLTSHRRTKKGGE
jgi:hypothetical protein